MTKMTKQTTMRRTSSHISPSTAIALTALIYLAILCSSPIAKGQAPPRELLDLNCTSHDCPNTIYCRIASGKLPPPGRPYMINFQLPGIDDITHANSRGVAITYSDLQVTPRETRKRSCTVWVKLIFPASFGTPAILVITKGDASLGEGVSAEVHWHYHFSGEEAEFSQSFDGPFDYRLIDPSHTLDYSDAVNIKTHLAVSPVSASNGSGHVRVKGQEVVFVWA